MDIKITKKNKDFFPHYYKMHYFHFNGEYFFVNEHKYKIDEIMIEIMCRGKLTTIDYSRSYIDIVDEDLEEATLNSEDSLSFEEQFNNFLDYLIIHI